MKRRGTDSGAARPGTGRLVSGRWRLLVLRPAFTLTGRQKPLLDRLVLDGGDRLGLAVAEFRRGLLRLLVLFPGWRLARRGRLSFLPIVSHRSPLPMAGEAIRARAEPGIRRVCCCLRAWGWHDHGLDWGWRAR